MAAIKKQRLSAQPDDHEAEISDASLGRRSLNDDSEATGSASDTSAGTDDVLDSRLTKSKKTLKRKRRATEPSRFGSTLQSLLSTDVPSAHPLSLKPSVARRKNDEKLELQAKKMLRVEKKDKEDKGRITDIIGGWGGESERALRKVAQRGVVKLFNVIQQTQAANNDAIEDSKASRGQGKPSLPAPTIAPEKGKSKGKHKDNLIGRGKEAAVEKDEFFDMIRSGGIVSKT